MDSSYHTWEVQRSKLIELSTLAFTFISHTISVSDEAEVGSGRRWHQAEFYIRKQLKSIESLARANFAIEIIPECSSTCKMNFSVCTCSEWLVDLMQKFEDKVDRKLIKLVT